jgi:hypothetical protein
MLLAFEIKHAGEASPAEYAKHVSSLKQLLPGDAVLIISKLASYVRNRLVRHHVPFIVPGTQMFLPMLMIDLRERFPRGRAEPGKLTPSGANGEGALATEKAIGTGVVRDIEWSGASEHGQTDSRSSPQQWSVLRSNALIEDGWHHS